MTAPTPDPIRKRAHRIDHILSLCLTGDNRSKTLIDLLADEYSLRRRSEPQLAIDEYLQRFPALAAELRSRLGGGQAEHLSTSSTVPSLPAMDGRPGEPSPLPRADSVVDARAESPLPGAGRG